MTTQEKDANFKAIANAERPFPKRKDSLFTINPVLAIGLIGSLTGLGWWAYLTTIPSYIFEQKVAEQRGTATAIAANPTEINADLRASSVRGIFSNSSGEDVLSDGSKRKSCTVTMRTATPVESKNPDNPPKAIVEVLSAEHCFDSADQLQITGANGNQIMGDIIRTESISQSLDLNTPDIDEAMVGFVKFNSYKNIEPFITNLPLGVLDQSKVGQRLQTCGFPISVDWNEICQSAEYLETKDGYYVLKMLATIGDSGESYIDENGHIVCTHYGHSKIFDDGLSLCSPITETVKTSIAKLVDEILNPIPQRPTFPKRTTHP